MMYLQQSLLILASTALLGGLVRSFNSQSVAQPKLESSVALAPQAKTSTSVTKSWKTAQLLQSLSIDRQIYQGKYSYITALAIAPDSTTLAIGSHDYERAGPINPRSTLSLWDLKTGQLTRLLFQGSAGESFSPSDQQPTAPALYGDIVDAIAFSPDGQSVAAGLSNKMIKVWSRQTGAELYTLKGHTYAVAAIAFSPDGKTLVSSSPDATIRVWNLQNHQLIRTISTHDQKITVLTVSPDSKILVASGSSYRVKLWNLQTGQLVRTLAGQTSAVNSIAFGADHKTLSLFYKSCIPQLPDSQQVKSFQLWNWQTGKAISSNDGKDFQTFPTASSIQNLSPDRQTTACSVPAITSAHQSQVILSQAKTGDVIHRFEPAEEPFTFSPDGQFFINVNRFGGTVVQVWR